MDDSDKFDSALISVFRSTKDTEGVATLLLNALMMVPGKLKRKLVNLGLRLVITPTLAEQFEALGVKDWTLWQHAERLAYYPATKTIYIAEGPGADVYGPTVFLDLGVGLGAADAYLTKIAKSDILADAADMDWKAMDAASQETFSDLRRPVHCYATLFSYELSISHYSNTNPLGKLYTEVSFAFPKTLEVVKRSLYFE